jgi:hypothetical protein
MGSKITQLIEETTPTHDDLMEIVQDPGGAPLSRKSKLSSLFFAMQQWVFGSDAGSTDAYVVTLSPAPIAYVTGQHYRFKANTANTGACTVNFNSLGAKTIKKAAGGITTDLDTNDIRAGQWVDLVFDGTNMQMQSLLGNSPSGGTGGIGDVVGPSSATDKAIARFDTTTGKLIQNSVVIISDAGAMTVPEISAPSTPASGTVHIYAKSDKHLYIKDSTGTETDLSSGGSGSIAPLVIEDANTVAQRNGANAQSFYLYSSYTDTLNYDRLAFTFDGTNWTIQSEKAGTGTLRQLHLRYGATRRLAYDGGQFYPDANNVTALGSSTNRFSEVRAVNSYAQTSFILENGTNITDAGATFGGVVKFGSNVTGDGTWSGGVNTAGSIGSNQNDYNPASIAHFQRWNSSTAVDITGMTRFQVQGQTHLIVNVGANNITLKHQNAGSSAANRFLCSTGADIVLAPDQAADVIYDATISRWRAFKRN